MPTPTSHPFLRLETGMHTAMIRRIDLDAAQRYLVTGSNDKTVRVWSLADGQLVRVLRPPIGEGNEGKIYAVAISPDGQTVAAGGWTSQTGPDNSIYLFNRASGELQQRLNEGNLFHGISINFSERGLDNMLTKELEVLLNNCFQMARFKRHEFLTVEHLLLALLDDTCAIQVLRACGVDLTSLKNDLSEFLEEAMPKLSKSDERDTQPSLGFQRVSQRAVYHVQSSGKKEVTSLNVLVAIFGERESQAFYFLDKQNISRSDVVSYICGGTAPAPPPSKPSPAAPTSQPSPPETTLPSWLIKWGMIFLLTLDGLLFLVPSHWVGIGLILLTLILFLWKIFPPFLRWLSPETPRMVANIIVGITVGLVTTAVTHYLWAAEPASITGMIMAIVGWWLWGEHNRS